MLRSSSALNSLADPTNEDWGVGWKTNLITLKFEIILFFKNFNTSLWRIVPWTYLDPLLHACVTYGFFFLYFTFFPFRNSWVYRDCGNLGRVRRWMLHYVSRLPFAIINPENHSYLQKATFLLYLYRFLSFLIKYRNSPGYLCSFLSRSPCWGLLSSTKHHPTIHQSSP